MRGPSTILILPILALAIPLAGCDARVRLDDTSADDDIRVTLDANTQTLWPGKRIKFWVDVENRGSRVVTIERLRIELTATPRGRSTVALRRSWDYAWKDSMSIGAGKKLTVPIVPEVRRIRSGSRSVGHAVALESMVASEFAIDQLASGQYEIRALLGDRLVSTPYSLTVDSSRQPTPKRIPLRRIK